VLYAKGVIELMRLSKKKATMFVKPYIVMTELRRIIGKALKIANQSDIIIAALGESAEMSGESSSRITCPFHRLKRTCYRIA
jgi:beta-glucosidase